MVKKEKVKGDIKHLKKHKSRHEGVTYWMEGEFPCQGVLYSPLSKLPNHRKISRKLYEEGGKGRKEKVNPSQPCSVQPYYYYCRHPAGRAGRGEARCAVGWRLARACAQRMTKPAASVHANERPPDDNRQAGCSSAGLVFEGGREGTRASESGGHGGSGSGSGGGGGVFFLFIFSLFFSLHVLMERKK